MRVGNQTASEQRRADEQASRACRLPPMHSPDARTEKSEPPYPVLSESTGPAPWCWQRDGPAIVPRLLALIASVFGQFGPPVERQRGAPFRTDVYKHGQGGVWYAPILSQRQAGMGVPSLDLYSIS